MNTNKTILISGRQRTATLLTALANSDEGQLSVALDNAVALDDEGWGLIGPFGEWAKTRVFREGGQVKEQKFIQVLDNESADAMMAKEDSFFRAIKRALIGIPVFKNHGDLNDIDPKALSNEKNKIKLGVVDRIRKTDRGIEARFALDNDGAEAVAAGWKYPSAFWWVLPIKDSQTPIANSQAPIRCRPFKLISVALTQYPNISGVESLANARSAATAADREQTQTQTKEPDMKLIAGWLLAQGIALANTESPTESQVLEAFQKLHNTKAGEVVALGNDKTTLAGKITTLEASVATEKTRADQNVMALGNEQTARKAERKRAAVAMADLLIHRGKKTVAERDATILALENSTDFDKDAKALLDAADGTRTTTNQNTEPGKALANQQNEAHAEYDREFKKALANNGQDPIKAHAAVMKLPGLAEKLKPKAH